MDQFSFGYIQFWAKMANSVNNFTRFYIDIYTWNYLTKSKLNNGNLDEYGSTGIRKVR